MATQDQQNNNSIPTSRQSLQSNLPQQTFKIRGMKTDLSESSFENDFAFENMNMRINIVDNDNTLFNLTNERGTVLKTSVSGIPIGVKKYDVDKILLITTVPNGGATKDKFWCISCTGDTLTATMFMYSTGNLVQGDFGLSADNPLEIEHYKDGDKDFFYIVDGINNLKSFWVQSTVLYASNTRLEYNSQITGNERITAKQTIKTSNFIQGVFDNINNDVLGNFFSGAIVYCFSYITNQGHKTNIIDISEIIYIRSANNKKYGLEPNKNANININIKITGLSNEFNKIEIYSLYRSSLDGEITTRKVSSIEIANNNELSYTDLNKGEIISYQELLNRFNSSLIPSTLTIKTNSLFLGNIKTNNYSSLKSRLISNTGITLENINVYPDIVQDEYYSYEISSINRILSSNKILSSNIYYYGIQLQDKNGNWTPTIYIGNGSSVSIHIPSTYVNKALEDGYVAVRAMIADNNRIHKFVCQGMMSPTINVCEGKYGIDYYSNYFLDNDFNNDIYGGTNKIAYPTNNICDIYSPDIEFNENLVLDDSQYSLSLQQISFNSKTIKIDTTINGNTGILYNSDNTTNLGKSEYNNTNGYIWYDAITGYQKALQMQFWNWHANEGTEELNQTDNLYTTLRQLNNVDIHENVTKYKIYTWQPSGSLNDSNGRTSVLRYKRISKFYDESFTTIGSEITVSSYLYLFDTTTNNIPISREVYSGIVNQEIYPSVWSMQDPNTIPYSGPDYTGNLWDDDQIPLLDGYMLEFLDAYKFVGQPIEVIVSMKNNNETKWNIYEYPAIIKGYRESGINDKTKIRAKYFGGSSGSTMNAISLGMIYNASGSRWNASFDQNDETAINEAISGKSKSQCWIKTRVTNNFNRQNSIKIGYKTPKHIVASYQSPNNNCAICSITNSVTSRNLSNTEIENSQWIVCNKIVYNIYGIYANGRNSSIDGISSKTKLVQNQNIVIPLLIDDYNVFNYECLKTEPYSQYDENQVTCCFKLSVESYFNNLCRYDKNRDLINYNGVTSDVMNKLNLVYNQKNNFFIFSGITSDTVTDDTLDNTILYSDTKVANEKEDTFVNFPITNFFTIDSNINKINKLITYNDKILCFSDDAIVQILYNENVVINTDSVQSLGLASTDKVTGSQLITNTYGCLNKWSIGIYNNALYFNDDLNKKMMVYNGEFVPLNETLGIETLNSKFFKNVVWNPNSFGNIKLNIDKYAKDVHYTTNEIDIAFNTTIGNFTSLYSYNNIPFVETIGDHSLAFEKKSNSTYLYFLREGKYNEFFGTNKSFWTTVIINQNSLVNKTISFVDFVTEAYSKDNNNKYVVPQHNYTFDKISFWNDYQNSSSMSEMKINYKMYGQSLLKRKFRIWRINRFRSYQRLSNRNYDTMSNPWHYLKLSVNPDVSNNNYIDDYKLTMHWLNVNYR